MLQRKCNSRLATKFNTELAGVLIRGLIPLERLGCKEKYQIIFKTFGMNISKIRKPRQMRIVEMFNVRKII